MQATETKKQDLNLEDNTFEPEQFQTELHELESPERLEASKIKLHELSMRIEEQMNQSRITMNKLFHNIGQEKGMGKITNLFKHVKRYLASQSDQSTMDSSLRFLTATLNAFSSYKQEIPIHIRNFQSSFLKITELKKQCVKRFKETQVELKARQKELEEINKNINTTKKDELKEELKIKQQELQNILDNLDIKMRRFDRDLKNANITSDLFREMKKTYELLLRQIEDFVSSVQKHKDILMTVGPAVVEVQKVVQTFDKFAQAIDDHKKKDNICVQLSTAAVKEITGTIEYTDKPWFSEKTVEIARKNNVEARDLYKKAFGPNIPNLDDYDITTGKIKKGEIDGNDELA